MSEGASIKPGPFAQKRPTFLGQKKWPPSHYLRAKFVAR